MAENVDLPLSLTLKFFWTQYIHHRETILINRRTAVANAQESTELINSTERLSGKWHLVHTATVDNVMNNSLNTHIHAELNYNLKMLACELI